MLFRSGSIMSYRLLTCLMLVLAACGVPQEIFDTRVRELDRCRTDLNRVQGDYASTQKNADELAGESSELRDRITTLESDRMRLSTNLSVQKQNAELFKNALTMADRRAELYKLIASKLQPLVDAKQVTLDNGKSRLFIGMPDASLFEAGRADLRPDGEKLLRELAGTMKQVNRDFLVACHSDNQALPKTSLFKSGWELTLARSIAIVRFFQGEGVDPRHLGAAGYSEFNFLADNADEAGRAQNRRVELVVMPNADELLPLPPEVDSHHKAAAPAAAPLHSTR
jgi:flagellar motor protein MotB